MSEIEESNSKNDFIDYLEFLKKTASDIFGIPAWVFADEPLQTEIGVTLSVTSTKRFTRERRIMLNKLKEQSQYVEFEEIQG